MKDRPACLPDPSNFQNLKDLLLATVPLLPDSQDLSQDKAVILDEIAYS